jgi:hypothetical protein
VIGEDARQPLVFRSEGIAILLFHASRDILGSYGRAMHCIAVEAQRLPYDEVKV